MKLILLLALGFTGFLGRQTDSWEISYNKIPVLTASEENEQNIVRLTKENLNSEATLIINYKEANPNTGWKRSIAIVDDKGNYFLEQETSRLELSSKQLKQILGVSTSPKIYSWSLPKDPAQAATVRIRKMHLCTLQLQ